MKKKYSLLVKFITELYNQHEFFQDNHGWLKNNSQNYFAEAFSIVFPTQDHLLDLEFPGTFNVCKLTRARTYHAKPMSSSVTCPPHDREICQCRASLDYLSFLLRMEPIIRMIVPLVITPILMVHAGNEVIMRKCSFVLCFPSWFCVPAEWKTKQIEEKHLVINRGSGNFQF